jgi:tRNA threonylcarbamoyl adenosine modification protein YeaZ
VILLAIECLGDGVSAAVSTAPGKSVQRRVKARRQDEKLVPMMDAALAAARIELGSVDAVVVANGPGRFTSARVGVTFANTIAWSIGKPVVAVSLLEAFAARFSAGGASDGTRVLAIAARGSFSSRAAREALSAEGAAPRGEAYVQSFRWKDGVCSPLGDPKWTADPGRAVFPETPLRAADLLGVAACRLAGGGGADEAVPLYLKPANFLKK